MSSDKCNHLQCCPQCYRATKVPQEVLSNLRHQITVQREMLMKSQSQLNEMMAQASALEEMINGDNS